MTKGLPTGDIGRCALNIYRKNTNIVYALVEHRTLGGVYRSDDKGESWTRMSDTDPAPVLFQPDPRRSEQRSENLARRRQHLYVRRRRQNLCADPFQPRP